MTDWDDSGLLEDVEEEPHRDARRKLLQRLSDMGVGTEELRDAVDEGRLALVGVELELMPPGPRFTLAEVAEQVGLTVDEVIVMRQAIGVSVPEQGERVYTEADVETLARITPMLAAGVPMESVLEILRLAGGGLSRLADALRQVIAEALLSPDDNELEAARKYAAATREFIPLADVALPLVFRLHMRDLVRTDVLGFAELANGQLRGAQPVAIAFADLVGFTKLGEQVDEAELGSVAARLASAASSVVEAPVRLVKTIGDAVMLVSPEPAELLAAGERLIHAVADAENMPELRVGISTGHAINRYGDWYGATVNLASRICGRARPGSILVDAPTKAAAEAADSPFRFSEAGHHRLKNVSDRVALWRARLPSD